MAFQLQVLFALGLYLSAVKVDRHSRFTAVGKIASEVSKRPEAIEGGSSRVGPSWLLERESSSERVLCAHCSAGKFSLEMGRRLGVGRPLKQASHPVGRLWRNEVMGVRGRGSSRRE